MINYEDIMNDEAIIEMYQKIDKMNPTSFNHGLKHIQNVLSLMKKLIVTLNMNEPTSRNLLIAVALHDVGQVEGRKDHGKRSKIFAESYLKGKVSDDDLPVILHAIEFHSQKEGHESLPLFTNLLCFADKMDFTKERLVDNYREKFEYEPYEDVSDIQFALLDDFELLIETSKNIKQELLDDYTFFPKIIYAVEAISTKLGLPYVIKINNEALTKEELDFSIKNALGKPQL